MLHIIWSIIIGFIVGLIARAILPGAQHLGFIMTTLLGIGGSIVGGLIGRLFSKPEPGSAFHPAGFIMSIIGAIILLFYLDKVGGLTKAILILGCFVDARHRVPLCSRDVFPSGGCFLQS
jgi:uncharacterized membrane protein YeaQ/YmgE (transglycosylase-associated protein family)